MNQRLIDLEALLDKGGIEIEIDTLNLYMFQSMINKQVKEQEEQVFFLNERLSKSHLIQEITEQIKSLVSIYLGVLDINRLKCEVKMIEKKEWLFTGKDRRVFTLILPIKRKEEIKIEVAKISYDGKNNISEIKKKSSISANDNKAVLILSTILSRQVKIEPFKSYIEISIKA